MDESSILPPTILKRMSVFIFPWLLPFLLFLSAFFLLLAKNKKRKLPPGPPRLPIIGNLHQVDGMSHLSLWELSKKYGPLMYLKLGSVPALVISSAELATQVLKTQDLDFCNRPPFVSYQKLSYNFLDIAFTPYSEYFRNMRKIWKNELVGLTKVQSFASIREEEVAIMIAAIADSCSPSTPVNLTDLMFAVTSTVICRAAFGRSYRSGGDKTNFHGVFTEAQYLLATYFMVDYIPWLGWIDYINGKRARLEKGFREMDVFYEQVIDEHLEPERANSEEDLVDVLIRVQKENNLTRDHIKAMSMNIYIAGTDTGAATVVWAMTELIKKPKVMKKVQEEIRSVIGNKGKVEETDLPKLDYFKYVVLETFRMHPAAPLLVPRETTRPCKLSGYEIAQKTMVFVNAMAIGQEAKMWENPAEFCPERFIGKSIDYKGQDFRLIPFGAGRRICPGMHLGTVTVELSLANLLYSFDWKLPAGMNVEDIDMASAPGITVHKKSPLFLVPVKYTT